MFENSLSVTIMVLKVIVSQIEVVQVGKKCDCEA